MSAVSRRRVLAGLAALGATGVGGAAAWRVASEPEAMPTPQPTRATSRPSPTVSARTDASVSEAPASEVVESQPAASDAASEPGRSTLAVPLLCRAAWGAAPPRPAAAGHEPVRLTLHHTAVVLDDNRKAPARLRQHQRYHQDSGFSDIAYHVGVDRNGNVYELRDPSVPGETFTNYDPTGHFLLLAEGEFGAQVPSDAQLEGLAQVIAGVAHSRGIGVETLTGHRDHDPTSACPGDHLYARLGDLQARATQILQDVDPVLSIWCDDAAFDRVAAIERGDA